MLGALYRVSAKILIVWISQKYDIFAVLVPLHRPHGIKTLHKPFYKVADVML